MTTVGADHLWSAALDLARREDAGGAVDPAIVALCVQLHAAGVDFDESARRIRAVVGRPPSRAELSAFVKLTRPTVRPVGGVQ